jgi:hypothetical protein
MKRSLILLVLCAVLFSCLSSVQGEATSNKVKIFILVGQSNMQGHCRTSVIANRLKDPKLKEGFEKYQKDGKFVERDDVFINHIESGRHGPLSVGYGAKKDEIGPELAFGWAMGNKLDEDVLIIKAAWGGKSLERDFFPPNGKMPSEALLKSMIDKKEKGAKRKKRTFSKELYLKEYGKYYRLMMKGVEDTLKDIKQFVPNYKDQGYEIAGFVWFQGYNDKFSDHATSTYQENMGNFIRSIRKDLKSEKLPFVIGAMGHNGKAQRGTTKLIADAQIAVAEEDEFKQTVVTVKTVQFWDYDAAKAFNNKSKGPALWSKLGSNQGYHYFGSAQFFEKTGTAFADEMLKLTAEQ